MTKKHTLTAVIPVISIALLALPGKAQEAPVTQPDGTRISLSGTVDEVEPHAFELDYGGGMITVEMDDWDTDADALSLVETSAFSRVGN